ncbi:MAG: serine/threonine protein kinase [Polyangiaceae bacterium]|nr:serine/threonine protein kinase [Polyangiaceae bacterium]
MNLVRGSTLAGKFRLQAPIGSGGMGVVWVARNETTHSDVAIKVLERGYRKDAGERFRQEARIGAMLAHRNVVRIFDLVEERDGALVLVMERLRGQTLADVLTARGPLSARCAVALAVGVLDALTHAHAQGFVHRDIKPANVFLSVESDGVLIPKVLDFGIARASRRKAPITSDGLLLGTPEYMSPEQVRGMPVDERSDVFAVGTVLYEMLVGTSPFAADSVNQALVATLERNVERPEGVELALWAVLEKALAKRREDRFPTARAFSMALLDALSASTDELSMSLQRIQVSVPAPPPALTSLPPPVLGEAKTIVNESADEMPIAFVPPAPVLPDLEGPEGIAEAAPMRVLRTWHAAAALAAVACAVLVAVLCFAGGPGTCALRQTLLTRAPAFRTELSSPLGGSSSAASVATPPATAVAKPAVRTTPASQAPRPRPRDRFWNVGKTPGF